MARDTGQAETAVYCQKSRCSESQCMSGRNQAVQVQLGHSKKLAGARQQWCRLQGVTTRAHGGHECEPTDWVLGRMDNGWKEKRETFIQCDTVPRRLCSREERTLLLADGAKGQEGSWLADVDLCALF